MRKRFVRFSGIAIILVAFVVFLFLKHNKSELFTKDYYMGVVTVQGESKPEVNFMDKNLENIGEINLNAKDFLTIYNYNKVEQDKDSFYFVQDSSAFSEKDSLLKVDKDNFKQSKLKIDTVPDYFKVGQNNIYILESPLGTSVLSIFDKEKNTSVSTEKLNKPLSPSMFEYNSDLYYYINDKNKVNLYNHTKKRSELSIDGVDQISYTDLSDDTAYILGKSIKDGHIGKFVLTEYNLKTKKMSNIVIPNKDSKYVFEDLILVNNKIILQEDISLVAFKNKKEVVYIDMDDDNKIKSILLDEYPQSISLDKNNNIIFVSKNSISIYDKDFKLIQHKKIDFIKEEDYERKFNSYILIG